MSHHGGWATQGSTGVSQEAEGVRENVGKNIYCGFHRNEWAGGVSRFRIGYFESSPWVLGYRDCT